MFSKKFEKEFYLKNENFEIEMKGQNQSNSIIENYFIHSEEILKGKISLC
jgi:hypothetical protein